MRAGLAAVKVGMAIKMADNSSSQISAPPADYRPSPASLPTGRAFSFYTVEEVGKILQVSSVTVTKWFSNYPGVLDLGTSENVRLHKRGKKLLRIPPAVLERFIKENSR